jgi:rhamnogalacturonan endolyase
MQTEPTCTLSFAQLSQALTPLLFALTITPPVRAQSESNGPTVVIEEEPLSFTLSNGIVTARYSKRSGDLTSLLYKGLEMFTDQSGHAGGYWSHDTTGGKETITRVTIDPRSNGGERGEVSVKGISGGLKMGPGAAGGGDIPADISGTSASFPLMPPS